MPCPVKDPCFYDWKIEIMVRTTADKVVHMLSISWLRTSRNISLGWLFVKMPSIRLSVIAAGLLSTALSQSNNTNVTIDDPFALWPTVDQGALAQSLNITSDCLDAL